MDYTGFRYLPLLFPLIVIADDVRRLVMLMIGRREP